MWYDYREKTVMKSYCYVLNRRDDHVFRNDLIYWILDIDGGDWRDLADRMRNLDGGKDLFPSCRAADSAADPDPVVYSRVLIVSG